MRIEQLQNGKVLELKVSGIFDMAGARAFKAEVDRFLQAGGTATVSVDLSCIQRMDCVAMGTLLLLREKAIALGKSIVLRNSCPWMAGVLELASFDRLFDIVHIDNGTPCCA